MFPSKKTYPPPDKSGGYVFIRINIFVKNNIVINAYNGFAILDLYAIIIVTVIYLYKGIVHWINS